MYAQAVFPDRWRCAGIRLAPHTLGHALLLQRLGNPAAGRPANVPAELGTGHTAQAAHICSGPWQRAVRRLDGRIERLWMAWAASRIARRGPERASEELWAYLRAAWPVIQWWSPGSGRTRALGAELIHILVNRQRDMGLSLEAALAVPLAVAHWDAAAAAEREGALTIQRASEARLMEEYDRLVAGGSLPRPGTVIHRRN